VPFSREDIEPAGQVPGTTALAYIISRDGKGIGRVHAMGAVGWVNSGEDPQERIARRLNEVEDEEGFDRLADALVATLEM
jgi:hypothetical protein